MFFLLCQIRFNRPVAVDSVLLMPSGVRFAHITFQFISSFLSVIVVPIMMGGCLGTCWAFMVTMLNCCRGELALWCSLCVGWHKRNLSLLAAASWHQEMGFWDTEEEWDGKRMREIFRGEGAWLSQHYDLRWMRIQRHRRVTEIILQGCCIIITECDLEMLRENSN